MKIKVKLLIWKKVKNRFTEKEHYCIHLADGLDLKIKHETSRNLDYPNRWILSACYGINAANGFDTPEDAMKYAYKWYRKLIKQGIDDE